MNAQHTPGPRVHLRKSSSRSSCRYSAQPSCRLRLLSIQEFSDAPDNTQCAECRTRYEVICADLRAAIDAEELRAKFESLARDSYGFKRSRKGNYVNAAVARDWKWFQIGVEHARATEGQR